MNKLTPSIIFKKGIMKGFEYVPPERQRVLRWIEEKFRKTLEIFGYQEVDCPLLQPIEFYLVKSGEELLKNTYTFQTEEKETYVLRPELTPSVAYMIAREDKGLNFPLRWWSHPVLFRKERPQKGRKRQFKQLNADIFDRADSKRERYFDDAEIIAVAVAVFESLGFTAKDIVVPINSRALMERLFENLSLKKDEKEELMSLIDRADKISGDDFKTRLLKLLPASKNRVALEEWLALESLEDLAKSESLRGLSSMKEYEDLLKVFELLEAHGVDDFCRFSPKVVRGLGYYTGTVFEAFDRDPSMGVGRALMGGGRYDHLTREMGGNVEITGVGFGLGQIPLEEMMQGRGMEIKTEENRVDYYIVVQSGTLRIDALQLARKIRKAGKSVLVDESLSKDPLDKVNKQLARASNAKAKEALLLFPDEWRSGNVIVKNLDRGEQKTLPVALLT